MTDFTGKAVFVTGGSKGIGAAACEQFAKAGAAVAVASRTEGDGRALADRIADAGGTAAWVRCDVADEASVAAAISAAVDRFGRLDTLVNNAGIYVQGTAADIDRDAWDSLLAVNLTGAYLATRAALPHLAKTQGSIVNVASEAGLMGIAGQVAYNVSKGGMIALTRSCAVDFAPHRVRVNCVCPGTTLTPLVEASLAGAADGAARQRALEAARPLHRLGTPQESAAAILFLASERSAFTTGAILSVDGGATAW